jgi:hypothetical protein
MLHLLQYNDDYDVYHYLFFKKNNENSIFFNYREKCMTKISNKKIKFDELPDYNYKNDEPFVKLHFNKYNIKTFLTNYTLISDLYEFIFDVNEDFDDNNIINFKQIILHFEGKFVNDEDIYDLNINYKVYNWYHILILLSNFEDYLFKTKKTLTFNTIETILYNKNNYNIYYDNIQKIIKKYKYIDEKLIRSYELTGELKKLLDHLPEK